MVLAGNVRRLEWLHGLLDFVLPPLCPGCGGYVDGPGAVCDDCLESIQAFKHPLCLNCLTMLGDDRACTACGGDYLPLYAYGDYSSPLRDIIIQFKFKGVTSPARVFAHLLHNRFGSYIDKKQARLLVPIPLHRHRESIRGYNQAALLAGQLAVPLNLSVADDILYRTRNRQPQTKVRFDGRQANVAGVFETAQETSARPACILVDDVVTTGSTLMEARRVLVAAGYDVVAAVSIAHGV